MEVNITAKSRKELIDKYNKVINEKLGKILIESFIKEVKTLIKPNKDIEYWLKFNGMNDLLLFTVRLKEETQKEKIKQTIKIIQ